jgi:uncharacterized oxidoreductase
MVTVQVNKLIDFVADVFAHADSSAEEAKRIATYLTTANLTGHDSHGVIRVPVYIRWRNSGMIIPNQKVEVPIDTPSLAVVDGKFGYGQTVGPVAVKLGIEKCKAAGLAAIATRNSGHIGRIGDWAEMAAAAFHAKGKCLSCSISRHRSWPRARSWSRPVAAKNCRRAH